MITENTVISKPTVQSLLRTLDSGVGLDISKNHTGITMWYNGELTTHGFKLEEYTKEDPHAEYRMRLDLKKKLLQVLEGKTFEYCVIEDVYGGDNFDTTRKLLALQTVIDEIIFDGSIKVKHFFRYLPSEWLSKTRLLHKQDGKLKSKIEVQGILEYLEFDFYLKYVDYPTTKTQAEKRGLPTLTDLFFEDICDSCGILLSVIYHKNQQASRETVRPLRMKDVKVVYIEDLDERFYCRDKRIKTENMVNVNLDMRCLESSLLSVSQEKSDEVLYCHVPVKYLGEFGMRMKFDFYASGTGYLVFYNKKKKE